MSLIFWLVLALAAVALIALWRNQWNFAAAWQAIVAFLVALGAAGLHLWGGQ